MKKFCFYIGFTLVEQKIGIKGCRLDYKRIFACYTKCLESNYTRESCAYTEPKQMFIYRIIMFKKQNFTLLILNFHDFINIRPNKNIFSRKYYKSVEHTLHYIPCTFIKEY